MARTVMQVNGKLVVLTRAQKKSEKAPPPKATPAPQTRWQKFKRDAVG